MSWKVDLDALVEETMAFAKSVKSEKNEPDVPIALIEEALAQSFDPVRLKAMVWVTSGSEEVKQRVASFKAHQERFRREREEYFERTMSKIRPVGTADELKGFNAASDPYRSRP